MLAAGIAGCGSSSSSSNAPAASGTPASSTPASSSSGYGAPSTTPAATTSSVVLTTKQAKKLGTVLAAGTKRMTVYLLTADKGGKSTCAGQCVSIWMPVTGTATTSGGAISADLGTTTRADGTKQITYKGHPLYYFSKDGDAGDAYGQGIKSFGGDWYVLAPSGNKVDKS
jgi:predicted lipoprotein with Yx(FWY)xxD motif